MMNDWLGQQVPDLVLTHPGMWAVAWDQSIRAIVPSLEEAVRFADQEGPATGLMIRQITAEPIRVPALTLIP